jgi:predicted ribosome quality control (RQC) complex YloA/Tae2 family protein
MQVDFLTMACFRDQLDGLLGARVQQVVLPDARSIALELYAGERVNLYASTDPQASRMLLVPEKPRRGVDTQTPFLLLLRKWVRGARLVDVTQPPWERVLILHFSGRAGECRLVVELMGRYSNIVLVGVDGTVLDAVKHVTSRMSRYRTTLPGQPYQPPPPPRDRKPPAMLTEEGWADKLIHAPLDEPLHQWLLSQLLGVSRVAARELAVRATGDAAAPVRVCTPQTIAAAVQGLFKPLNDGWWTPHVALDEAGSVIAFTPFEPRQFARIEPAVDISQAMWRFFEGRGMADSYAAAREAVSDLIIDTGRRLENRLSKLRKEEGDEAELADLRIAGELLLMYQNQVPGGAGEVSLLGYDGTPRVVALNPELTPVENAQAYFRRYEKMRRAADHIPGLVEKLKSEQAYLDQLEADLALAESRPEIDAVRDSLAAAGWAPPRRRKIADQVSEPRRFEVGGFRIYVGRNSRQNEQITFRRAGPEDLWLHVRGLPGAHVVIRRGRQEVPEDIIKRAAGLAAFYSRARDSESQVAVDVTERRFVRRMRGKHPGMVTYRNERTVWVTGKDIQDWAAEAF